MDFNNMRKTGDICRLCLATDIRMHAITNTVLQNVYEKIANIKLNTTSGLQYVCHICHARLKQCYNLIQQATRAEKLLTEAAASGAELFQLIKQFMQWNNLTPCSQWTLTTCHILKISLDPTEALDVKQEQNDDCIKEEDIKTECESLEQDAIDDTETELNRLDSETQDDNKDFYDSEDDLPLRKIKNTKIDKRRSKKTRLDKKENLEIKELHLDEEQQMAELLQRSESLNYLNSPYKCSLCYKGFREPSAFVKHKDKHDAKSGHLECKICHFRYNSKPALNSHVLAAHSRRFRCTQCDHTSLTKNQAVVHSRWHEGHQYPCKLCDKRFLKPTSYLSHMRKVHCSLSEHVCRKCGESFAGRHGLLMHLSKSHRHDGAETEMATDPTSDSYCAECGVQFATLDAYNLHSLTSRRHKHNVWKEDGSKCKICDALVSEFERDKHERMHARQLKPKMAAVLAATPPTVQIPCTQCSKSFTSRSKMQMHVRRMHLGVRYNKNVVCEVCGKHCTSYAALRYHQRRHTGEKPYSCAACAARFVSREHWRLHQRVHSGERPYSCSVCGHRFSQKPALNRHYIVHTGAKPYECQLCNKAFTQSASLKKHTQRVHLRQPREPRGAEPAGAADVATTQ